MSAEAPPEREEIPQIRWEPALKLLLAFFSCVQNHFSGRKEGVDRNRTLPEVVS